MNNTSVIVENIVKLMDKQNINASKLSQKAGISRSTLSKILKGTRNEIKSETLIKIAEALKVNVATLCQVDFEEVYEINELNDLIEVLFEDEEIKIDDIILSKDEKLLFLIESKLTIDKIRNLRNMKK